MPFFTLSRANIALSTTTDSLTIISAASRQLRIWRIGIAGVGATTGPAALGVYRSTGGTTGGAAVTPKLKMTEQGAAAFTNFTTWAAQPTVTGDPLHQLGFRDSGGNNAWQALSPDRTILLRNLEQASFRSIIGTISANIDIEVEEI